MQNVCYNFSNAVSKSARQALLPVIVFLSLGAAPSPSPTPTAAPDYSQVPEFSVREAQKNSAKDQYQIGDRIALLADVKIPDLESGSKLTLKLPEGSSKLEDQGWYIDQSNQFTSGVFRFVVSPIQVGKLTLPTLLVLKEDQSVIGRTSVFSIQVIGPEKKEGQAPELLAIARTQLPIKYWVMLVALTLALVAAIIYLVRRYQKTRKHIKVVQVPSAPSESDHVIALRKIETLFEDFPYTRENLKPISFGLSEILKHFFSKRFKIEASESTTDEMIELLRKESLSGSNLKEIQSLFQELDLIKFTKNENYSHLDQHAYQEFKVKAQVIVQKWALLSDPARSQA